MRGFVFGSVVLAALYVLVQPGASSGVAAGTNWLTTGFHRLLAPGVAAIPNRGARSTTGTSSATFTKPTPPPNPGTITA